MSDDFEITAAPVRGRVAVLRVRGRIDTKSASQLLHRCGAVRNAGQDLMLNLSEVNFVASSGIGALLALTENFQDHGSRVRFVALSSAVNSVIKLLNLDQFLSIDRTEEDGYKALESKDAA